MGNLNNFSSDTMEEISRINFRTRMKYFYPCFYYELKNVFNISYYFSKHQKHLTL